MIDYKKELMKDIKVFLEKKIKKATYSSERYKNPSADQKEKLGEYMI